MSSQQLDVAVVGATGAVGREMLSVLRERAFPVGQLRAMASHRSAGTELEFGEDTVVVEDLEKADFDGVDIALFSAGSGVSRAHADRAVEAGAVVVDNTSAFRMDDGVPLVVPEVNPETIGDHDGIIANPNCSTIQMVVALDPIADRFGLGRIVVSTYQSASGAGQSGVKELMEGVRAKVAGEQEPEPSTFAHPLAFDALAHIDTFDDSGYTREELKMARETRKIMDAPQLEISATCVRIPVIRSHGEAVTVDTEQPVDVDALRQLWRETEGVEVVDDPEQDQYPTSRRAEGTDPCWVGRLRADRDRPKTLHFWVVSDNLRKGAALNAVQIAEILAEDYQ